MFELSLISPCDLKVGDLVGIDGKPAIFMGIRDDVKIMVGEWIAEPDTFSIRQDIRYEVNGRIYVSRLSAADFQHAAVEDNWVCGAQLDVVKPSSCYVYGVYMDGRPEFKLYIAYPTHLSSPLEFLQRFSDCT